MSPISMDCPGMMPMGSMDTNVPSWQVNVVMGMMLYLYLATTDYLSGEI